MNPFVQSIIAAGVRWLLTIAATHEIAVSDDQATQLISGAVALAMLVWSVVHKSKVDDKIKDAKAGY